MTALDPHGLLPCPHCSGKAELHTHQIAEDVVEAFVMCSACFATTDNFEDAYAPTGEAIAAWNRRSSPSQVAPANPAQVTDADAIVANLYAAEAENARLRALPLKDEVERVLIWYENNGAGCRLIHSGGDAHRAALAADGGNRARSLLSRLRAGEQEGWRTIESAPKDGTDILAAHDMAAIVVQWQDDHTVDGAPGWASGETDLDGYFYTYPVFVWQPLPALPAAPKQGEAK